MSRTLTAPLERLVSEGHLRVEGEGCAVLLSLVDGGIHAVDDACLHRGTALSGGLLRDGIVTCPAHLWQYDVRTGERHDATAEGLATFPVDVVGDEVRVTLPDAVRVPSLREVLLAHARGSHLPAAADPAVRTTVPQGAREAGGTPLVPRESRGARAVTREVR